METYKIIIALSIPIILQSVVIVLLIIKILHQEKKKPRFYYIKRSGKHLSIESLNKENTTKKDKNNAKYNLKGDRGEQNDNLLQDIENDTYPKEKIIEEDFIANKVLKFCSDNDKILDKQFKLDDLAMEVGTNRNYISRAINRTLRINFNQLKNYYRVFKTCKYFIAHPGSNISQLFEVSNFTSFSSFCSAFDKHTHFSPHKWCKDVTKRISEGERVNPYDYMRLLRIKDYYENSEDSF